MALSNSSALRVFVTRPIAAPALRRLAECARVDLWDDDAPPPHADLVKRSRGCDAILTMVSDRIDAALFRQAPHLRVVSNLAVGLDNIDLAAATRAGVAVGHTPGVLADTTAELAIALMFAVARRVVEADRFVRARRWRMWTPRLMLGRDLAGATLGIIGFGSIGRAVARRAAALGMNVIYALHHDLRAKRPARAGIEAAADPPIANPVPLARLLAESDFISLNVPLTPATRGMIGREQFAAMKRGAILINTARGAVVDQKALIDALRSGRLGGAGLDVLEVEPIAPDDPLLKFANVTITPHIGSASHRTRELMAELAVDNILDVFAGRRPRCCANPAVRLKKISGLGAGSKSGR